MKVSWVFFWMSVSVFGFVSCASDDQQQGQQEELEQGQQEDGVVENDGGDTDLEQFNELGDGGLDNLANAAVNEVGLEQAVAPNNAAGFGASNLDPGSRVVRYVISDGTSVYAQPSADGSPVTTLTAGDVLMVTIPGDGWAQIAEGRFISEGSLSEQIVPRTADSQAWSSTPPAPPVNTQDVNANLGNGGENPFNQGNDLNALGDSSLNQQGTQENFGNSQQFDQAELNAQTQNNAEEENQDGNQDNEEYNQENDQEYQQQEEYDE
ncbi:MAG: hypothetical protein AB8C84_11010 [Oligoflexales bacterium]